MTSSEFLKAAKVRHLTQGIGASESLRCDVDYPVYLRALFLLKRGLGVNPRTSIFEWCRDAHPDPGYMAVGFDHAIALAEISRP